jgi:photosystem II stability/assembly factor-like uncharacterized protein
MTPEERELRRALDSRSGEVTPEFRARLSSTLSAEGRPSSNFLPALAAVAAVVLMLATVGVLLLARQARNQPGPVAGSTPTATAKPTPVSVSIPGVLTKPPGRIPMPSSAELSAASSDAIWTIVYYRYLYRSIDRGITWEQRPVPAAFKYFGPDISFVSATEGWFSVSGQPTGDCAAESIAIWHTTDAGVTWQPLGSNGIAASQCKQGLSFVDSTHGYLDAWDPNHAAVIYATADGGHTWTASSTLPTPPSFKTVCDCIRMRAGLVRAFGSTLLVTAWQQAGAGTQYVYRSTDAGATWTYLASAPEQDGNVVFVTATRWIKLIGPDQSTETTDGGTSWHNYSSDYSQAAPVAADFVFADSQVGYGTVRGEIGRTVDGGLHWTWIHTPGT